MKRKLILIDILLEATFLNQSFGQVGFLLMGDHPADHIAAENIYNDIYLNQWRKKCLKSNYHVDLFGQI
jgi:hypothetical protein